MKINEPKLRRDIRDDRTKAQLQTMGEDLIQAIIGSPLKPHEKRSLLHDVIDGCKAANRNDIPGWRSTMKITERQLRKGIRQIVTEAAQKMISADWPRPTDVRSAKRLVAAHRRLLAAEASRFDESLWATVSRSKDFNEILRAVETHKYENVHPDYIDQVLYTKFEPEY